MILFGEKEKKSRHASVFFVPVTQTKNDEMPFQNKAD